MNTATFKNFEIKATYKGDKKASWSDNNFNNHMVKVVNTENGNRLTFEFWASIASIELKTEYDIINAFYSFVSDAVAGSETFDNFCSELGYSTDSREAEKTWKKCQKQLIKLRKIFDGDIYNLLNELGENWA